MCHDKEDDPDTDDSVTRNKVVGVTDAIPDKSPVENPWELTLETEAESATQPSGPAPSTAERKQTQPEEERKELHVGSVETTGAFDSGIVLEPVDLGIPPGEINTKDPERDPGPGREMRRMDRPGGRGVPLNEHLEEPIVIDVDPRSPGPEYGEGRGVQ